MRAASGIEGRVARGRLTVFLGSIIVGDIPLSVPVGEQEALQPVSSTVAMYRKIFASYSHKDLAIVEEFERYARAVGDEYLRDMVHLKPGEVWDDRLTKMIDDADVFQLFWSWNSLRSGFVRREWEYALSLGHKGPAFVRPVYWQEPLPVDSESDLPPEKLRRLHFQRLRFWADASKSQGDRRSDADAAAARTAELADARRRIEELTGSGDLGQAFLILEETLMTYPGEPEIEKLHRELRKLRFQRVDVPGKLDRFREPSSPEVSQHSEQTAYRADTTPPKAQRGHGLNIIEFPFIIFVATITLLGCFAFFNQTVWRKVKAAIYYLLGQHVP